MAGRFSFAQSVISRLCIRLYQTVSTSQGSRNGRPKKITANKDGYFRLRSSRDPPASSS